MTVDRREEMPTPPLAGELLELLSWRDQGGIGGAIHAHHIEHVRSAVVFWLALASGSGRKRDAPLAVQFDELSKKSQLRLLSAPETYRRLVYVLGDLSPGTVEFFANSLRAERCLAGHDGRLVRPVWSAMGDAYFPAGPIVRPRESTASGTRPAWRAPTIAHGPAIDGVSPFCTIEFPDGTANTIAHSPGELTLVVRRVRDAVTRISGVSAEAAAALLLFTSVIVCRKIPDPQAAFASISWPAFVGKTAVINAHIREVAVDRIANALIHEAIHAALFMAETREPFVIESSRIGRAAAVSPWSGRSLPISNYIHACFVWYGLWGFWRLAMRSGAFATAGAATHMTRASSGFLGPSLLVPLTPLRRFISPTVLDSIRESQETVLDNNKL